MNPLIFTTAPTSTLWSFSNFISLLSFLAKFVLKRSMAPIILFSVLIILFLTRWVLYGIVLFYWNNIISRHPVVLAKSLAVFRRMLHLERLLLLRILRFSLWTLFSEAIIILIIIFSAWLPHSKFCLGCGDILSDLVFGSSLGWGAIIHLIPHIAIPYISLSCHLAITMIKLLAERWNSSVDWLCWMVPDRRSNNPHITQTIPRTTTHTDMIIPRALIVPYGTLIWLWAHDKRRFLRAVIGRTIST